MEAETKLKDLFRGYFQEEIASFKVFAGSGSTWRYRARLIGVSGRCALGVVNPKLEENKAFIEFGKTFQSCGLPVPKVYAEKDDAYIEEDIGEKTLDEIIKDHGPISNSEFLIEKAVKLLPHFQITGGKKIDYRLCYAFDRYGKASVEWDVGYFKRCFLGPLTIPFNEEHLKENAAKLGQYIDSVSENYFVNRDYQNRNIVVGKNERLVVIDYQQGRAGALQYDIAKYLAQPSLGFSSTQAKKYLDIYIREVKDIKKDFDEGAFLKALPCFELIQGLQRLGGYGNVGIIQGIGNFKERIVPAIIWFKNWLAITKMPIDLPEITKVLEDITSNYRTYLGRV